MHFHIFFVVVVVFSFTFFIKIVILSPRNINNNTMCNCDYLQHTFHCFNFFVASVTPELTEAVTFLTEAVTLLTRVDRWTSVGGFCHGHDPGLHTRNPHYLLGVFENRCQPIQGSPEYWGVGEGVFITIIISQSMKVLLKYYFFESRNIVCK